MAFYSLQVVSCWLLWRCHRRRSLASPLTRRNVLLHAEQVIKHRLVCRHYKKAASRPLPERFSICATKVIYSIVHSNCLILSFGNKSHILSKSQHSFIQLDSKMKVSLVQLLALGLVSSTAVTGLHLSAPNTGIARRVAVSPHQLWQFMHNNNELVLNL